MRVTFCGASGTGKTTLAEYVANKHGLEINPVGSRSVAKEMGFDSPYDVDKAGKRGEFQHRLIASKRAWERSHESFVSDRTTFDNLVYLVLHDVRAVDSSLIYDALNGLERYTHIIYCPVKVFFAPGDDPVRIKSQDYHTIFDLVLVAFLERYYNRPSRLLKLDVSALETRKIAIDKFLEDAR